MDNHLVAHVFYYNAYEKIVWWTIFECQAYLQMFPRTGFDCRICNKRSDGAFLIFYVGKSCADEEERV